MLEHVPLKPREHEEMRPSEGPFTKETESSLCVLPSKVPLRVEETTILANQVSGLSGIRTFSKCGIILPKKLK